jgi:hypothetical protein
VLEEQALAQAEPPSLGPPIVASRPAQVVHERAPLVQLARQDRHRQRQHGWIRVGP